MIYKDYIRVLYIDMGTEKIRIEERKDLVDFLGGTGVASKLLEENMKPELAPLHPDQPIILAIGPLTYVYPVMTKTVAMFISPLTGELGESHAGGRLASMLFAAGFDAVVITGQSRRPTFLSISPYDVIFRDARAVWGTNTEQNIGQLLRATEQGAGKRSVIRIGPAGENQVAYSCVTVDRYRHFGRLGLGAVFGSKMIKAITVTGGDRSIPIQQPKEYIKLYREIFQKCTHTDMMVKYHDIGTSINILSLNNAGGLPTKNLQYGSFERADQISGEAFTEKNLIRKMACMGCPVGCIHIGQYRHQFSDHGYEYEAISIAYDYELIYALGTYLCLDKTEEILELIEEVETAGLDAMSTGVALGWATEAIVQGHLSTRDTIAPLEFGNQKPYLDAVRYLASAKNEFYKALGKGVRHAAKIYGGADYAMQIAGNEMPGYHTGYGALVGAAIGARHSHLCNGGYSIDQGLKEFDADSMLEKLTAEEVERGIFNSLVMCLFARKIYDRELVIRALGAIGYAMTDEKLTEIADRIYKTRLRIKRTLGFSLDSVRFPKRFFQTPSMNGVLSEDIAYEMLNAYQKHADEILKDEVKAK